MKAKTRAVRNNNPCNIRKGADWFGLSPDQPDNAFCKFIDPVYGFRAFFKIIFLYVNIYHLDTIKSILYRYAPPQDHNQTDIYINKVCEYLHTQPNEKVNIKNKLNMICLAKVISHIESSNYYSFDVISKAYDMAIK